MKTLIRSFVFFTIGLFLLPVLLPGVRVAGGFVTILMGGFTLTLLFTFIKPLLSIITFPLNLITMGMMSMLVNMFLLYLLTVFIPSIKIQAFVFDGLATAGFIIPRVSVNTFFAFVLGALVLYCVHALLSWLTR